MPRILTQDMKTISTLNAQPMRMTSKIHLLVMMDIAGATGNQMSEHSGISPSRVSIIRNSPMFTEERNRRMNQLREQVIEKKSDSIAEGDPIEGRLKELASSAVETYANILRDGKSDSVKKVTADSILDRAGYKAHTEKTKVSIEITEKMATRFEEVLAYDTHRGSPLGSALTGSDNDSYREGSALEGDKPNDRCSKNDRETKVNIETEMSQ